MIPIIPKILLVIIALLVCLVSPALAAPFNPNEFPYISRIELQNTLILYLNQELEIDPLELRTCFLGEAYKYQGVEISELFSLACPDPEGEVVLVLALLNCGSWQWIFFYILTS